jgi:hypothetical protein
VLRLCGAARAGGPRWLGPEELLARCDNEDVGLRRGTGPSGHGHAGHLATAADFGRTGPRSAGNHRASLSSAPARQLMYEPVVDPTCRSLRIRRFISPASETKPSLRGTCVGCNVAVDRSWKRHRRPETIDRPELWRSVKPSAKPTLVRTQHLPPSNSQVRPGPWGRVSSVVGAVWNNRSLRGTPRLRSLFGLIRML